MGDVSKISRSNHLLWKDHRHQALFGSQASSFVSTRIFYPPIWGGKHLQILVVFEE